MNLTDETLYQGMDYDTLQNINVVIQNELNKAKELAYIKEHHKGVIEKKTKQKRGKTVEYYRAYFNGKDVTGTTYESCIHNLYIKYTTGNIKPDEITMEQLYQQWHKVREKDKTTGNISVLTYEDDEDSWNRFWKDTSIAEIKVKDLKAKDILVVAKEITGNGKILYKTFSRAMTPINLMLDYAIDEGYCCTNVARQMPTSTLKFKASEDKNDCVYTKEEREILLNYLYSLSVQTTYSLAISLAACLGKRISEIRALKWEDYDEEKGTLYIKTQIVRAEKENGKGKTFKEDSHLKRYAKPQKLQLTNYAIYLLSELKKINGNKTYIINSKGSLPIETSHINEHLKQYCNACNIPYYPSHKFRFFAGSEMYNANVNETEICNYLNHVDVECTRHYKRTRIQPRKEILEQVLGFTPS